MLLIALGDFLRRTVFTKAKHRLEGAAVDGLVAGIAIGIALEYSIVKSLALTIGLAIGWPALIYAWFDENEDADSSVGKE